MGFFIVSSIGTRLKEARNRKDLTQGELAKAVGTSQQTITNIERGDTLDSRYFYPICEVLEVSYNWLVKGDSSTTISEGSAPYGQHKDTELLTIATECLKRSLSSVRAINAKHGKDPEHFDESLILQAFSITLEGELTGDFVTAALKYDDVTKTSNGN